MDVRRLSRNAILCTVALALSLVEQQLPLGLWIPVPGLRLGLSNVVTLFAVLCLGPFDALAVSLLRVGVLFLITGNFTALVLSFSGSMLALLFMLLFKRGYKTLFSIYGVSMAGAGAHNLGQLAAAAALLKTPAVFFYAPVLMVVSVATGALTAFVSSLLIGALYKSGAVSKNIRGLR